MNLGRLPTVSWGIDQLKKSLHTKKELEALATPRWTTSRMTETGNSRNNYEAFDNIDQVYLQAARTGLGRFTRPGNTT